jgi:hypothetical protein
MHTCRYIFYFLLMCALIFYFMSRNCSNFKFNLNSNEFVNYRGFGKLENVFLLYLAMGRNPAFPGNRPNQPKFFLAQLSLAASPVAIGTAWTGTVCLWPPSLVLAAHRALLTTGHPEPPTCIVPLVHPVTRTLCQC